MMRKSITGTAINLANCVDFPIGADMRNSITSLNKSIFLFEYNRRNCGGRLRECC